MTDDVENGAALQARGVGFVDEIDRDADLDDGVGVDTHEVDMDRLIGDAVELHIAGQNVHLLAVNLQRHDLGEEAAFIEALPDRTGVDGHHFRVSRTTVDHGGDEAFLAGCLGCGLTGAGLGLGRNSHCDVHGDVSCIRGKNSSVRKLPGQDRR